VTLNVKLNLRCGNCGKSVEVEVKENINPVLVCSCGAKSTAKLGDYPTEEFVIRERFHVGQPKRKTEAKDIPYGVVVEMEGD